MRQKVDPSDVSELSPASGASPPEFSCENEHINHWFRNRSRIEHDEFHCRVMHFRLAGDPDLVGFYALSIRTEPQKYFVGESFIADKFFHEDRITTIHLQWLAVKSELMRRGLGTVMMGSVVSAAYNIIKLGGAHAVTLQYIDANSKMLYSKYGFKDYGRSEEKKLYLSAQEIIDTVEAVAL